MEEYEMFGQDLEEESAGLGIGAMTQPQPMDLRSAVRPVANSAEAGTRRNMWAEIVTKFQTNPNLQRAIGLAGAQLMQPIRPGETRAGNIGKAAVIGTNAYQMGQQADFDRALKLKQEGRLDSAEARAQGEAGREAELHTGRLNAQADAAAASRATTEQTVAGTKGTEARTKLTGLQIDDAIKKAQEYDDSAALREIKRDLEQEEAEIQRGIPREAKVQSRLDELRAGTVRLKAAEEQLAAAGATRREAEEKTKTAGLVREVKEQLRVENPEEYKDMMLGRGKYSARQRTTVEAQIEGYSQLWKLGTPEERAAKPQNAYVKELILKERPADKLKIVTAAIETATLSGEPVPKEAFRLQRQLLEEMGGKEQTPGAAAPAASEAKKAAGTRKDPHVVKSKAERDALPDGSFYRGPDGIVYEKKKAKKPTEDSTGVSP